jgi:membrane protease YdiL (CAAX protease family)
MGLAGGVAGFACMYVAGRLVLGSVAGVVDLYRYSWWWMVLTVGVLGPVAEELEFRGVVWVAAQGALGGPVPALVFTSVVFAILHHPDSLTLAAGYGVFGLLVGCLRIWSGGVVAPVLAHVTCNVGVVSYVMLPTGS